MQKRILLFSCLLMLFVSGCAGLMANEINQAMELRRTSPIDTKKTFDESKIVYIKELRCYAYREDEKKRDTDGILFNNAGKKILSRDEAIEQVQFYYGDQGFSTAEKVAGYATTAWATPVGFIFGIAENIAMLPTLPYILHVKNKFQKESVESYLEGQELFEQGHYRESREKYMRALSSWRSLIYYSDIYYKIAETYDRQGDADLANKNYNNFLEYSIALYPDYFQEYNPKLTNDTSKLDKEFESAEEKTKRMITSRSSPVKWTPLSRQYWVEIKRVTDRCAAEWRCPSF